MKLQQGISTGRWRWTILLLFRSLSLQSLSFALDNFQKGFASILWMQQKAFLASNQVFQCLKGGNDCIATSRKGQLSLRFNAKRGFFSSLQQIKSRRKKNFMKKSQKKGTNVQGAKTKPVVPKIVIPLLDNKFVSRLILELDDHYGYQLCRSFFSVAFGLVFLLQIADASLKSKIGREQIPGLASYKFINKRLIGKSKDSKLLKSIYSEQSLAKRALANDREASLQSNDGSLANSIFAKIDFLSENQAATAHHASQSQVANGSWNMCLYFASSIIINEKPLNIDGEKAFQMVTNTLTEANSQITATYLEERFDITADIIIDHCSNLLGSTSFEDDYDLDLLLLNHDLNCFQPKARCRQHLRIFVSKGAKDPNRAASAKLRSNHPPDAINTPKGGSGGL
eukprot:TRINITY_DN3250_c1_g3_i1.p1 TRINITY_DN3250_c1_g3~~TRINITY_DN3250_c1_g3_i1.p1  ORF type:complete len:398 (+),score=15.39 TRINITY_DN3250_c1_g3_i1:1-1194(+)